MDVVPVFIIIILPHLPLTKKIIFCKPNAHISAQRKIIQTFNNDLSFKVFLVCMNVFQCKTLCMNVDLFYFCTQVSLDQCIVQRL